MTYLQKLSARMAESFARSNANAMSDLMGVPRLNDEEWSAYYAEYLKPENVEARRTEREKRLAEEDADRLANPDKYSCPECGRDYE